MNGPILFTERLILRLPEPADIEDYSYEAAVDVLGWSEAFHMIAPDNVRSIRLERLGATNRGQTRLPLLADCRVDAWGQTAAQWRAR